jgi:hypothetical protein
MKKIFILFSIAIGILNNSVAQNFGPNYIQVCDSTNTTGDYTILDTAALQTTGGANLIATHLNKSSAYATQDFTHAFGLNSVAGIYRIFDETGAVMSVNGLYFNVLNPTTATNGASFIQIANAGTDFGGSPQYSLITNSATDAAPDQILFITPNKDQSTVTDNSNIAVYYSTVEAKWALYKENTFDTFPVGDAYNVFATPAGQYAFTDTVKGTSSPITYINNPVLNGNPNAIILITQQYTTSVPPNDNATGVWYSTDSSKWAIYNENLSNIPTGSLFNVLIAGSNATGIREISSNASIKTYPIPASSDLSIDAATGININAASLSDISGRVLIRQSVNNTNTTKINVSGLSEGIYILKLNTDQGMYTQKVSVSAK